MGTRMLLLLLLMVFLFLTGTTTTTTAITATAAASSSKFPSTFSYPLPLSIGKKIHAAARKSNDGNDDALFLKKERRKNLYCRRRRLGNVISWKQQGRQQERINEGSLENGNGINFLNNQRKQQQVQQQQVRQRIQKISVMFCWIVLFWISALNPKPCPAMAMSSTNIGRIPRLIYRLPASLEPPLRLLYAATLGAILGIERSWQSRRSGSSAGAGLRTMALVSLGASIFCLCGTLGFPAMLHPDANLSLVRNNPAVEMSASVDASRMASSIGAGVGFIGAGVITNNRLPDGTYDQESSVRGLTTATAIWVSAAVGAAAGAGMYLAAAAYVLMSVAVLRIGESITTSFVLKEEEEEEGSTTTTTTTTNVDTSGTTSDASNSNVETRPRQHQQRPMQQQQPSSWATLNGQNYMGLSSSPITTTTTTALPLADVYGAVRSPLAVAAATKSSLLKPKTNTTLNPPFSVPYSLSSFDDDTVVDQGNVAGGGGTTSSSGSNGGGSGASSSSSGSGGGAVDPLLEKFLRRHQGGTNDSSSSSSSAIPNSAKNNAPHPSMMTNSGTTTSSKKNNITPKDNTELNDEEDLTN